MDIPSLPDFERTQALSQGNLDEGGLAECHGVACGLLVRQPSSDTGTLLTLLQMLEIVEAPGVAVREAFAELMDATGKQLADEEMRMVIWLPSDETTLETRTHALAQWCNGFLASIGAGGDQALKTLSEEAGEALRDLKEIAKAEVSEAFMAGEEGTEEEEQAFAEIVEYIRVAVLMLREDLRGPDDSDSIH